MLRALIVLIALIAAPASAEWYNSNNQSGTAHLTPQAACLAPGVPSGYVLEQIKRLNAVSHICTFRIPNGSLNDYRTIYLYGAYCPAGQEKLPSGFCDDPPPPPCPDG